MKIQFLGTAAAEGVPALFCRCEMCEYARKAGGREIRTRSGAIVDGRLKLDFGPDSYHHMLQNGLNYADVHSVLITHSHSDHFSSLEMEFRGPVFAHLPENEPPMTVYGNEAVGEGMKQYIKGNEKFLAFQRMIPFETRQIGEYRVTALEAVHCVSGDEKPSWPVEFNGRAYCRSEEALFYLVEKGNESLLYAHDTCEFTKADMDFLKGRHIDLISLDCTGGKLHYDYSRWVGHMSAEGCRHMRELLLENGAADGHTLFVASHFSHNGCLPYNDLAAILPGFMVSYDGLTLETPKKKEA